MIPLLASLSTFALPVGAAALWLVFCWWSQRVVHNPRRAGDIASGLAWRLVIVYARLFHWMRIVHRKNIPSGPVVNGRPIVVVANHTAGVDPLLIQAALPFYVRWMMAADMRAESLEGLWSFLEVISIDVPRWTHSPTARPWGSFQKAACAPRGISCTSSFPA
jgi:hypothetical protein